MATITVRGTGTAYGTPDEAALGLSVESLRGTADEARAALAERTKALVTLCHEVGLAETEVTTTGIGVAEHGEHDREGRWQHRGYWAANRVSPRVRDVTVIGSLLTRAVDRVGATVDGPTGDPSRSIRRTWRRLARARRTRGGVRRPSQARSAAGSGRSSQLAIRGSRRPSRARCRG